MKHNYFNLNQNASKNDGQVPRNVQMSRYCPQPDSVSNPCRCRDLATPRVFSAVFTARAWKHVAMIFAVLVMSMANIGMAWAYSMEIYFCPEDLWGEYWDESTKYCQLNLNKRCDGNDAWETYSMTKTAWTKDGKAIWKGNPTNLCKDGAQQIQFLRKLKSNNYQEWSNQVYDGWMMYNSTNTFYYGSWQALSKDQVVNGGYVYFDNSATQWSNTYKYLVIGHNSYSRVYPLTQISNTNLWYVYLDGKANHVWEDATYCAFIGSNSSWSDGEWGPGNVSTASKYTATFPVNYSNSILSGKFYLYRPVSSSNGMELNRDRYDAYGGLNWDITFKAKIKAFGEDSYEEGASKGKVSVNRYSYGSATACNSSSSKDGVLAVGGTSGTYTMGYVSTRCTLTVANVVDGYTFRGWYADGSRLSETSPYRTYSPKETTVYAYFEANSYTITYNNMTGATNHPSNPSSYGVTSSTITLQAPTKDGYVFAGWCSDEDCKTRVTSIPSGSTGNKVLYAKWLSAHEPGKYVTATGSGGYGKTLTDVSGIGYERYLFGISSSKVYVGAAARVTSKGSACVLSYATATGNFDSGGEWLSGTAIGNNGSGSQDFTGTEFASCGTVDGLKLTAEGQGLLLYVKGYSELAIVGKDNNSTKGNKKYLQVKINGSDDTKDLSTDKTIRRYTLTPGTAYTIQITSLSNQESQFWGFSLKPGTPTITSSSLSGAEYAQGASATPLSVTATKLVSSGTTLSYQWYSNTTASNTGGTIIGGATSASYTPPTTSAGTKYYYCVVSETGCNSTTSAVSGAITVTAAAPSCSAPTSPNISGTTAYTAGNTISLTASATGTSGSTTYTWYKGADWATASAGSSVGSSATFTKASCVVGDAGTYWCNISHGTGCEVQVSKAITVSAAPTVGTFSPASGSTVKSGTTVTVTGSTGSTVYYQWSSSSSAPAAATIVSSGTAGTSGAATVTTSGISSSATYLYVVASNGGVNSAVSSASYTIDDTAPTLSSSVPANSATNVNTSGTIVLTFSEAIASVDATKFTLTNATKGAVAIDGSNNTKVNIAYSGASNSTTVTLATAAGAVTDAVGNSSAALSNISFTTKAAASLTALVSGTRYDVAVMVPNGTTITSSDQFVDGISANSKFELIGTGSGATGTTMKVKSDAKTVNGIDFANSYYFGTGASLSSNTPTNYAIKFIIPSTGTLTVWVRNGKDIKLGKEGVAGTALVASQTNEYYNYTLDVTAGTYYLYATAGSTTLYAVKFDAAVACTTAPTVTAGSNSSVGSTTATVSCTGGISSLGTGSCTITEYGFVISESANPEIGGSGVTQHEVGTSYASTGTSFSKDLTGLTAETTYYVRPYATNGFGTAYGTQTSFTTEAADDECTPTTLFSMVVNPSAADYKLSASTEMTSELTSRLTSYSGGTPSIYNTTASSNKDVIKNNTIYLGSNDVYLKVVLSGGNTLQAGDVITITTRTAYQPYITKTTTRTTTPTMTKTGSSDPYTYSITLANTNAASGKDIIGGGTLYFWKNSSAVEIRSITITRPCEEDEEECKTPNITNIASTTNMTTAETKSLNVTLGNPDALTGTVSYAWTNSDGTTIADAAKATGANTSRLTLTEPAAGTYTFKCTVTNDCGGGDSQSANSAVFTVVVTASSGCTEIAKVIVSGTSTGTDSGTKIAETGGYGVKLENTTASHGGNTGYKIGSNNYVYLQLASVEQFQNGDKVKVYITNLSDQGDSKLHIFQGTTAAGTEVATVETPVLGWNEATLSGVTSGNRSLTIHRSSGTTEQNHYIYAFAVERCKDCSPATFEGMSYDETEYTVGASASAITVTNPENADSYQWYYNTVNDRSDATKTEETGATSASFTPSTTAAFAIRYYWCELTNDCGTVKTPTVGITVRASKSNPTVTWTNPSSVNYGGGGYSIRATVDQTTWDGTLTASMLTAPTGIAITKVTIGADAGKKYIEVKFDVLTSFDTETYGSTIPFVLSLPETTNYNELVSEKDLTYSACAGGGDSDNSYVIGYSNADATNVSSSAAFRAYNTASNWYSAGNTTFTDMTSTDGFSISATNKSGYYWKNDGSFTTSGSSDNRLITLKLAKNNGATIRWTNEALSFTKIRIIGRNTSSDESSTFTVSNGTTEKTFTFESGSSIIQTKEVVMDFVAGSEKGVVISGGTKELNVLIELVPASGGGTLTTTLAFASAGPLNKQTSDANFTNTASVTGANSNTLGTITYSSNHPEIASVNTATGEVTLVAAGTAVITATLSRSGCYKSATASYTINVTEVTCEEPAGVIAVTSGSTEVCSVPVGLTLTHIEGATVQWYNGDAEISNGGSYTITNPTTTTSVLSTTTPGNYSAKAYKDCEKAAAKRSNTIKVVSAASEVDVTPIIEKWYIKNGRPTPDIALWQLGEGTSLKSVAWSPTNTTGLTAAGDIYEQEGIVYLTGKEPSANETGEDKSYTLTLTVYNSCGSETVMSGKTITIVHQKNTDKHVLAFVVTGKGKGGWTEGISANQTTKVPLYNAIANNFAVQPTNIYSTDDEKKLKEYYSQYDILCITDYPNTGTKGVNGKSYVDAIGSLIDIRPILTMEAYVSGLANWRSKGVVGTRTTPTRRQYNMLLQCKDHEIFSGTSPETLGEGDDIMYRVNMVDSTRSRYAELDAVGKSSHASDTAALQGFTTGEMDLLALGLIDNGSGTDLQVGAERQTNMKARMMVLGINSYAMERLSEDGETVVINALNYLMKKNAEDIEDCSNYFLGGASGDARNWHNVANWSGATLPDKTQEVRILAPCEIRNGQKAHVARVKIVPDGNYKSVPVTGGSLTIAAGGALVVDGKVQAATAPNYYEARPTSAGNLTILASADAQGALIFDNSEGETQATVQMYSPSYWEIMEGTNKKKSYWSYVAIPIQDAYVGEFFYGAVTYLYDETEGWIRKRIGTHLHAFEGIGLSLPEGHTETFYGPLAPTEDRTVTLTKTTSGGDGENLIGNSWTAPIQIANFEASDFGSATPNVMIYCTGRDGTQDGVRENAVYVTATADNDGNVSAGQWVSIPINVPSLDGYDGLKVIPAMQAFQVTTGTETSLTLNYDKLVRDVNIISDNLTEKQHAPARRSSGAKKSLMSTMRVRVSGVKTRTDVWLLEDDRFSDEFDNGWEAKYAECDDRSAQLYAQSETGNMSFLAKPDIEGTVLGFAPSKDGNQYLFTFHYVGDDEYYLNDLKLTTATLISNENNYLFTYEEGDTNRFYISRQPLGAPAVATGMENPREEAKPRKFIYKDKMYILYNGRVFDATGKVVK